MDGGGVATATAAAASSAAPPQLDCSSIITPQLQQQPKGSNTADDQRRAAAAAAAEAEGLAYCAATKAQFQELLAEFGNGLSEQNFDPLFETLRNTDNTLNDATFVGAFRTKLCTILQQDHEQFWQSNFVDDSLMCLHDVVSASRRKKDAAGGAAVGWRPTGKTPAEQLRFYRTFLLQTKIKYLRTRLTTRTPIMQNLIIELESRRGRLEEMQRRREALDKQIDLRCNELGTANESLRNLHAELDAIDGEPKKL